ncbi:MAG: hypothetical protein K2O38_00905 [Muribaculaceae bacterium]|nr:hypothetical protein [Muribaculaceae bacterium]
MKLDFSLPKSSEISQSDFYAVNLRQHGNCLKPTGCPPTLQTEAGARNFRLPSGKILSIGDDRHDLMIDGEFIGALSSPFGALLLEGPGDDCIILTTGSAPEWLVGGRLRGQFTPLKSEINLSADGEMTMEQSVEPLKLADSYPRASGMLTATDARQAANVLSRALDSLESRAAGAALRVQPVWIAWQLLDAGGKVISRSEPQLIQSSCGFQGSKGTEMILTRANGKFTDCSAGSMTVRTYSVRLRINRAEDSWRRSRAAMLEILASPPLNYINGATGAFNQLDSSRSTLYISPLGADSASLEALKTRTGAEFASSASVIARIKNPLEGVDMNLGVSPLDAPSGIWSESIAEPHAVCAFRGGSAVVYADSATPGLLLAAPASSPLAPVGSAKVSTGRIHSILAPVGSAGGWNYGRHHLLVFATDGIYAVSIDRSLSVISSSLIHSGGVSGPEAVTSAVDAIYCACSGGRLLRLRGTTVSNVSVPFAVSSVAFAGHSSELWITSPNAAMTATIHIPSMRCSMRTDMRALRFDPESALAVDSAGALRDLSLELPKATDVTWRRRIESDFSSAMVEWAVDSPLMVGMKLILMADGGATPQRINSLTLNGRLNAPLRLRVFSPRKPYLTVAFSGVTDPQTRFRKFTY